MMVWATFEAIYYINSTNLEGVQHLAELENNRVKIDQEYVPPGRLLAQPPPEGLPSHDPGVC